MKGAGSGLIILGALMMGGALLYQPTVSTDGGGLYGAPSEVYNIGAMQYQELFFMGGAALLIAGTVLFAAGSLLERLEASGVIKPLFFPHSQASAVEPTSDAAPLATFDVGPGGCQWCGRMISGSGRRPCSELTRQDLLRTEPGVFDPLCRKAVAPRLSAAPAASEATDPAADVPGES